MRGSLRGGARNVGRTNTRKPVRVREWKPIELAQLATLGVVGVFEALGGKRLFGHSRSANGTWPGIDHGVQSRGTELNLVRIVIVTVFGEVQLAGMQVGTKEPIEPQRLLLDCLLETAQKSENTTAEICVRSGGNRTEKQEHHEPVATHHPGFGSFCHLVFFNFQCLHAIRFSDRLQTVSIVGSREMRERKSAEFRDQTFSLCSLSLARCDTTSTYLGPTAGSYYLGSLVMKRFKVRGGIILNV